MRLDAFRLIPSRVVGPIGVKWDDSAPSNGSTEAARVTPSSMRGPAFESRLRQGFFFSCHFTPRFHLLVTVSGGEI